MADKANIIKGDTVFVRRGRDKGKRGTVKAVFPAAGTATVEGINIVKRHTKPQQEQQQNMGGAVPNGGIIEKEAPLPLATLMYVCEKCKAPTRVRHGRNAEGRAARLCAKCGEPARESVKGA